jgi:hypothetical protein
MTKLLWILLIADNWPLIYDLGEDLRDDESGGRARGR